MTQKEAIDILKTGKNVFITGPAGSGKTFVVNAYIKYLCDHEVPIGITASTGIAATHIGGMTIHSWSGMGIQDSFDESELANLAEKTQTARRIKDAKVLIIDEVSMLHHFRLDTLNAITQHIRGNTEPFGGLQVVLCGDFFQLPPVSKYGVQDTHFIYRSEAWREGHFVVCYLHENHRQTDDGILNVLNEIRGGEISDESRDILKSRRFAPARTGDGSSRKIEVDSEDGYVTIEENTIELAVDAGDAVEATAGVEPTRLYTHNVDVDSVNDRELAKVSDVEFTYEMSARGRKPLVEALKRSCLAPEILRLKKGARVMCVKNNFEKGYVNGTLGVIVSCGPGVDPMIRTAPSPGFPDGKVITIEKATWQIDDSGKILAEIEQYPLRLAWAITVHKSQGMSLDAIEVDLSKSFEPGMGYVALSRVRTLAGLRILGMNENALRVHPEVLIYDRHLRDLSQKAERIIQSTQTADLVQAQNEFLAEVAPLHSMTGGASGKKGKHASKTSKLSTFEKTHALIKAGNSLHEMAKKREMTEETIISHLEKLVEDGSIEPADLSYLKNGISSARWQKLDKSLEEAETQGEDGKPPLLSAVKNKVGANISFKEIRLARVLMGYIKKKV